MISPQQQYKSFFLLLLSTSFIMFTVTRSTTAFLSRAIVTTQQHQARMVNLSLRSSAKVESMSSATTPNAAAATNQAEVVLVGCGAPNRGMGWYHAVQMLDKK
jgi:hypothetical protein